MTGGEWFRQDGSKFDDAVLRRRWEAGRCVCCGGPLIDADVKAIAEGVRICGWCHLGKHIDRPGELQALLRALVPS
jgi:hypothetical protein